jgi:hypothetical protein
MWSNNNGPGETGALGTGKLTPLAADGRRRHVFRWAVEHGCAIDRFPGLATFLAELVGDLENLRFWAVESSGIVGDDKWDERTSAIAAEHGHFCTCSLQWWATRTSSKHHRSCPWDWEKG